MHCLWLTSTAFNVTLSVIVKHERKENLNEKGSEFVRRDHLAIVKNKLRYRHILQTLHLEQIRHPQFPKDRALAMDQ